MKFMVECDFCGRMFNLDHKDTEHSKHENAVAFIDIDIQERYYTRKKHLACSECLDKIKAMLKSKEE